MCQSAKPFGILSHETLTIAKRGSTPTGQVNTNRNVFWRIGPNGQKGVFTSSADEGLGHAYADNSIAHPANLPASRFVTTFDGLNGTSADQLYAATFDAFGLLHDGKGTVAFADGHAEQGRKKYRTFQAGLSPTISGRQLLVDAD